jgi:hypothetical protein
MRTQTFGFNHVFDFKSGDPQFFSLSSLPQSRLQIVSRYPHVKKPTSQGPAGVSHAPVAAEPGPFCPANW